MFVDTRDNLEEAFQKYMHNMIIKGKDVPNTWARNSTSTATTTIEDDNDTT